MTNEKKYMRKMTYKEAKDLYDKLVKDGYPAQIWFNVNNKRWSITIEDAFQSGKNNSKSGDYG